MAMVDQIKIDDLLDKLEAAELDYVDTVFTILGRNIFADELLVIMRGMRGGASAQTIAARLKKRPPLRLVTP